MPIIRQYTAETSADGLPPSERAQASDFGGPGLSQIGEAGYGVGAAINLNERRKKVEAEIADVTNVRVTMAKARAEWDTYFREESVKSEPGDPNFSENFKQKFADYLGKTRDIAQTKKGQQTFDMLAATLGGHFSEKSDVFQAHSVGAKAKINWQTSLNAYASSVNTDPKSYGSVKAQFVAEMNDPRGQYGRIDQNVRSDLILKGRDQLAQSYIDGLVNEGRPELARELLTQGALDSELNPDNKQRLVHQADAGIRSKNVAAEHAEALAKKAQRDKVAQINDGLMGQFVSGKLNVATIRAAGLPAFGEGSQHTWVSMLKAQSKEWSERPVRTNPSVLRDLFERANLPDGDPRKITDLKPVADAYIGQQLSTADMEHASKWIVNARTDSGLKLGQQQKQFLDGMRGSLDKSTLSSIDKGGGERFYNFQSYVNDQVSRARAAKENPYELFDPSSPKYLGKAVPQFQSGAQLNDRVLSDKLNRALDPAKRRQAGETPAQYLQRMSK